MSPGVAPFSRHPVITLGVADVNDVFWRTDHVIARKLENQIILVPIHSSYSDPQNVVSLNEVGTFIWDRIDGVRTVRELVDAVVAEFDADKAEVERDVSDFLTRMADIGAVELANRGAEDCGQRTDD